jgi:mannose-6-phosphate isomerase-like protein (cupin superfamily)
MLPAVVQAGEVFENPNSGTRLEVRESTPDRVVFDRTYPPDTGKAVPHVHFDICQSWEMLSGQGKAVVDGRAREVHTGEKVEIPTGVPHQDIHNPGSEATTVRWTVEPVSEFVAGFASCYSHYLTRDELDDQDEFKPLQLFPILHATRAQSWLARIPIPLQKLIVPVGAALGRMRGYKPLYD